MRVDEAIDLVAIQVFKTARQRGAPITIGLVRQVLAELADHPAHREKARKVDPERVFRVASAWISGISRAHVRGHHQGG